MDCNSQTLINTNSLNFPLSVYISDDPLLLEMINYFLVSSFWKFLENHTRAFMCVRQIEYMNEYNDIYTEWGE